MAVNLLPVALLAGGMLYLNQYERGLVDTELHALQTQAAIFAAALGEGAAIQDVSNGPLLVPSLAQGMLRRLAEPVHMRARLFRSDGHLLADSRSLPGVIGTIQVTSLPPPQEGLLGLFDSVMDSVSGLPRVLDHEQRQPYVEHPHEAGQDYDEVVNALAGHTNSMVRTDGEDGGLVLSAAVPVRRYRQVLGAVMLSTGSANLERQVASVRSGILRLTIAAMALTAALSFFLAGTIARPIRLLADAAREVRQGQGRKVDIPDFKRRRDEIGELSVALAGMTDALWRRIDAIEHFAADVAHEIKNPLSSLRSAVETAARMSDPELQKRLMAIILDDVHRLDRLISDISDASRLDAEMSRLEREPVELAGILLILVQVHQATRTAEQPILVFNGPTLGDGPDPLVVLGQEGRLVQVFRNLIANAASFSPEGGAITVNAWREASEIVIAIEDEGPGIPEGKLGAIFDRFYSERPSGEKFGTHSGLGLSISKQIIEAHRGTITARNRYDTANGVCGARFLLRLPAADETRL